MPKARVDAEQDCGGGARQHAQTRRMGVPLPEVTSVTTSYARWPAVRGDGPDRAAAEHRGGENGWRDERTAKPFGGGPERGVRATDMCAECSMPIGSPLHYGLFVYSRSARPCD